VLAAAAAMALLIAQVELAAAALVLQGQTSAELQEQ
jgi:hypothetical protein